MQNTPKKENEIVVKFRSGRFHKPNDFSPYC